MKDNISIIFATIIGVLLIVILPIISILDRQDTMSYNLVLNETVKFVDNIRNNGYITKQEYDNYMSALASTSNLYKVDIDIYKKRLIRDVDSAQDTFIEEFELFNLEDLLSVFETNANESELQSTNKKNATYLLNENDEIYVKVRNTNETAGSVIYKAFAGKAATKVIDISYGGVVNNVNWELYSKIYVNSVNVPEVILEVPVNAINQTNIVKLDGSGEKYTYLYDLKNVNNMKITIPVQFNNVKSIAVGEDASGNIEFIELNNLDETKFNNAKKYIINNYIELNDMIGEVDLVYRQNADENYTFDIVVEDIQITSLELMSVFASVSILSGLGQDGLGNLSMGAESVRVELVN